VASFAAERILEAYRTTENPHTPTQAAELREGPQGCGSGKLYAGGIQALGKEGEGSAGTEGEK